MFPDQQKTASVPTVGAAATGLGGESRPTLTDFLDLTTLQEIQDAFTALTKLPTTILDADGRPLTIPTDTARRERSDRVLDYLLFESDGADGAGVYVAPIVLEGQQLGTIKVQPPGGDADSASLPGLTFAAGREETVRDASPLAGQAPQRAAAVQFLYLLANHITRLCYQEYQLRQRLEELGALYRISTVLSGERDLQSVLESAAALAADALGARGVAVRVVETAHALVTRAVSGFSESFLEREGMLAARTPLVEQALAGQVLQTADLAGSAELADPEAALAEGIGSMLAVGILHLGEPIGVLQFFGETGRRFRTAERNLAQAIAQLVGTAIIAARHMLQREEGERVQRQLRLATDVQQKMLPIDAPRSPCFDIAAKFVPSFELAGDFYDFLDLQGNVGLAIGDVAGKGIGAGLLMASVRAALRAYAQDVYDLDEIIRRVNVSLFRDTRDREFVTLFYGVLDPRMMRLTYCNAGHEPGLLLRGGRVMELKTGGMALGVDGTQRYDKGVLHLQAHDLLVLYTDGLIDAMNAAGKKWGRARLYETVRGLSQRSAIDAAHLLMWEMRRHIGLCRNSDDTTLVVVRVKPRA